MSGSALSWWRLDHLEKDVGSIEADIVLLDAHRGQRRRQSIDERHVVIARHGNVARTIQPMPAKRRDGPDRKAVVGADDRGEPGSPGE